MLSARIALASFVRDVISGGNWGTDDLFFLSCGARFFMYQSEALFFVLKIKEQFIDWKHA